MTVAYFDLLSAGDAKALGGAFVTEPHIEDPRAGTVLNGDLARFVAEASAWLREHNAEVERVAAFGNGVREVTEVVIHLDVDDGRWPLPAAAVADVAGDSVSAIRVYHSTWPLTGGHDVRPPLLPPDPGIVLTGAVADYQAALAAGDLVGVLGAYERDAVVREPSGGPYVFRGTEELRKIYSMMFADGGIPLQHCTATDDGTSCAIEYNVDRWGTTPLPPQCGVAVYVRGAGGRLAGARIYDDVAPPQASDTSLAAD